MNTEVADKAGLRLRSWGILTIFAVFFLIFVGGLVRGTGAGMGCPDWPRCFGQWVPPTSEQELPANYKEIYKDHGYGSSDFNVYKTWTEYLNRLVGVLIGFFIFLTLLFSFPYLKRDAAIFWLNLLAFFLVGFEGWIGAKVVDTNLAHWMVTIHMLLAIGIVALLIYTITRSQSFSIYSSSDKKELSSLKLLSVLALVFALVQLVSGTQVREEVDLIAIRMDHVQRGTWLAQIGNIFLVHKVISILVVLFSAMLYQRVYRYFASTLINRASNWLMASIGLQLLLGILLDKMAIPPVAQMLHLTIGSLSVGVQLFIVLLLYTKTRPLATN